MLIHKPTRLLGLVSVMVWNWRYGLSGVEEAYDPVPIGWVGSNPLAPVAPVAPVPPVAHEELADEAPANWPGGAGNGVGETTSDQALPSQ